jgi:putative acetyltransferase
VFGNSTYYPRFGFSRASALSVRCEFPNVPDEAFMMLLLDPGLADSIAGVARYLPAFGRSA